MTPETQPLTIELDEGSDLERALEVLPGHVAPRSQPTPGAVVDAQGNDVGSLANLKARIGLGG